MKFVKNLFNPVNRKKCFMLACLVLFSSSAVKADVFEHWDHGSITSGNLTGVAFGNGIFVAVGENEILLSTNGFKWTRAPAFSVTIQWSAICFGQGVFVAVGTVTTPGYYKNITATSFNGRKWIVTESNNDGPWSNVNFINNGFVTAGGFSASFGYFDAQQGYAISPDGYSWSDGNPAVLTQDWIVGVCYGNGLYVAATGQGTGDLITAGSVAQLGELPIQSNVSTSGDTTEPAISFSPPAYGTIQGQPGISITSGGDDFYGIVFQNGTFVAVGANGAVVTSSNGFNWYDWSALSGTVNTLEAITFADSFFVAVGANGTVISSPDGYSWTTRYPGTANLLEAITYGKGHFLAVGENGTVAISTDETPPTITSQPPDFQEIDLHGSVSFSVTATGATPLTYHWRRNGINITGATNSTYYISNVRTNQAGRYTVKVQNAGGSVISSNSILKVFVPDTQNPTVKITSPTNSEKWYNPTFLITGKAKDNVGVSNVFYSLNGSAWTLASTGNDWTNWNVTVALTPGTNWIEAQAVDASGNFINSKQVQFIYILP